MRHARRVWRWVGLVAAAAGCSSGGRVVVQGDGGTVIVDVPGDESGGPAPGDGEYPGPTKGRYKAKLPKVPRGHMPPPGKCRIWFPDRPPGLQPPPGDCEELERHIPPGAWLIRG